LPIPFQYDEYICRASGRFGAGTDELDKRRPA